MHDTLKFIVILCIYIYIVVFIVSGCVVHKKKVTGYARLGCMNMSI